VLKRVLAGAARVVATASVDVSPRLSTGKPAQCIRASLCGIDAGKNAPTTSDIRCRYCLHAYRWHHAPRRPEMLPDARGAAARHGASARPELTPATKGRRRHDRQPLGDWRTAVAEVATPRGPRYQGVYYTGPDGQVPWRVGHQRAP